ncbi:hypothetical protein ACFL0C_02415, partial [Patescibacteria group bacterium]
MRGFWYTEVLIIPGNVGYLDGTIDGAIYASNTPGFDKNITTTNQPDGNPTAGHQGVFIEEATTNLVTNPSFEHGTFNTGWINPDLFENFDYDVSEATFTENMAKRTAPGPFSTGFLRQGAWPPGSVSGYQDEFKYNRGSQISGSFYQNIDMNQGSFVFWYTPEEDSSNWSTSNNTILYDAPMWDLSILINGGTDLLLRVNNSDATFADSIDLIAGNTYMFIIRWDADVTMDGTNYASLTVDGSNDYTRTTSWSSLTGPTGDVGVGGHVNNSSSPANGIIEGFTFYRRPLFDGTSGIDVGNGNEVSQIYNSGSGKDPTLITGSWDVVFALPTNQSTGILTTGTGEAWSHPHTSNLLGGTNGATGFMHSTTAWDQFTAEGTPSANGTVDTSERVYAGGYYFTSDAANEGYYRDVTVSPGDDWVVRGVAHSDGTCVPRLELYDQTNTASIGYLDGTTGSTREDPDVLLFTGEAPSGSTTLRMKLLNTASSGTCYWHQVELLSIDTPNPSFESGSGDPWIPTGWSNASMVAGATALETTITHSGANAIKFTSSADTNDYISYSPTYSSDKYYSVGFWTYGNGAITPGLQMGYNNRLNDGTTGTILRGSNASWTHIGSVWNKSGSSNSTRIWGSGATGYVDDYYLFELDDVSMTAAAASEAESSGGTGMRVDGRDTLTQPVDTITASSGTVVWEYTPRHDAGDVFDFLEDTNVYMMQLYGDTDDYIDVYWNANNSITLTYSMNGTSASETWDTTGVISAGTTYSFELTYTGDGTMVLDMDGTDEIILGSIPSSF